jgi:hypothetical protein
VFTDECGQNLHHGRVVSCGVAGDALQCEDAADTHVELIGAELLDCFGVAVGHLPFAGQSEVPRGEDQGRSSEQARAKCQQPASRGIPGRLELRCLG